MARGGKIANKRKPRSKVRLEKKGSDESDEDYMVSEDDEFAESEDEYCSSLADDETADSVGEIEEEEELEELESKKIKKLGKPRARESSRRKNNGVVRRRKKIAAYSEEEREDYEANDSPGGKRRRRSMISNNAKNNDDIGPLYGQEENEKPRKRTRVLSAEKEDNCCDGKPGKKTKVSYQEDREDCDYDDSDDDDDEEFTPDDVDGVDDDEELPATKKNKVDRLRVHETPIAYGNKKKTISKALKRRKRKKPRTEQVSRIKNQAKEFRGESPIVRKRKKNTEKGRGKGRGRRKSSAKSESDFVSSGSSDHEYTVSEEEREQIREATEFCRRLAPSSRSSSSLKMIEEEQIVPLQRKSQIRKAKDKDEVLELKIEVGKQVCGICLSEEGKRTVRGTLNCCSHYFCFACIMEWSKVESRCPLCKQRFATISRTSREDGGHDLRDAVIAVPERDQVYQPAEEELLGYIDPYENVLCTECHQGGDDALMLLCDLCDSPAHTYCVGLGREVPEGNWYCDVCRPTALASTNAAPLLNPTPDHGANNNLSVEAPTRETFDLNELYVPETPLTPSTQANGHSPSPRNSIGDSQAASPSSGFGAFTLFERRRIQRQIHQLLNNRSRQLDRNDGVDPVSGISLLGSQMAPQHAAIPVRVAPQNHYQPGRLPDYNTSSLYGNRQVLSPRLGSLREQVLHHQASASRDQSFGGLAASELSGTNERIGQDMSHQQVRPCNSRSNTGPDASISLYQFREVSLSSLEKEQVQSMVRSHLKSLSRNSDLGYITFKYIARASTHTILAAFGLHHRQNEVYPVRTRPLSCDHLDRLASRHTCPIAGQCSSCFDWFIGNVVGEIMFTRVPLSSMD